MKIADLDNETRRVVFLAHVVHRQATADNLEKLGNALKDFDAKHVVERKHNLFRALEIDLPEIGEYRKHQRGGQ
jgi:hypothetical protein